MESHKSLRGKNGSRSESAICRDHRRTRWSAAMDTDLLVDMRKEDGRRLIAQLVRDGFDVKVAFWFRTFPGGPWFLFIGSSSVESAKLGEAFKALYDSLRRLSEPSISISEIKLAPANHPIARDAVAVRDRYASRDLLRFQGNRLGNLEIEEAYIYPRRSPWEVRERSDGRWEVRLSEPDDLWLACDSEED